MFCVFFFSSRRRHTRCALVTGVQTCALPISRTWAGACCDHSPKHANKQYPLGLAPLTSTVVHAASRSGRNCSRPSRFGLILSRVGDRAVKALAPCPACLLPESDAAAMLYPFVITTRSGWNSMRLFLCEKPSQGKDIGKVLGATQRDNGCLKGPGVIVTWCIGQVVEAAPPEADRTSTRLHSSH